MSRIARDTEDAGQPPASVSFEFFPPADARVQARLMDSARALLAFRPAFVSVTYGAGGSTQGRTMSVARQLTGLSDTPVVAHLTCIGASAREVDAVVEAYAEAGIRHVLALRGDQPAHDGEFSDHPEGYAGAAELVDAIARRGDFDISVACYPEVHPLAASPQADLDALKRKVDLGASRAISQFFFEADVFLRFLDRVRDAGIDIPVVPGILPVHSLGRVQRFAERCGARVPSWLVDLFAPLEQAPELRPLVAAAVCAELCTRLRDHGVHDFHFYTLNQPSLAAAVCHVLGRVPEAGRQEDFFEVFSAM